MRDAAPDSHHAGLTGAQLRALCRAGTWARPTAGAARGFAQANLVMVRETVAADFHAFIEGNPKPCPLLEALEPGRYEPTKTAPGSDLRTDLPRCRVFRVGTCVDRPTSIAKYWNEASDDGKGKLCAFLLGCSFTFEAALLAAGIPVRHIEEGRNVPMYRTNISCSAAGVFSGPMVVSMRPMTPRQADLALKITSKLPQAHGGPVHIGDPRRIGIADLARPDYGEAVAIHDGEVPVFWACGVTPIEAILRAKLDLAITHEPGHMFVTDLRESACG